MGRIITRTEIIEAWFNLDWPMEKVGVSQVKDFCTWHFGEEDQIDLTEDGLSAVCVMINGRAYGSLVANEYDTPDSVRRGTTR